MDNEQHLQKRGSQELGTVPKTVTKYTKPKLAEMKGETEKIIIKIK